MVGIREIRRNLSVYVARVKRGERFIVTERGHPVATLQPYAEAMIRSRKIRARGLIIQEPHGLRLDDIVPLGVVWDHSTVGGDLSEMREDRF